MKRATLFTMFLMFILASAAQAQDIIMKKNKELIKCKITEIGLDEIKYTMPEYSSGVTFAVDKDEVDKIVFENGKEMTFEKPLTNPASYEDNKKNAFKIDFLSPLTGNTTFAFEHSIRPGRSYEVGLGMDAADENPGGVFMRAGYKFIKDPDFYLRGMRYAHILKGGYIKPELAFSFFGHDTWYYNEFGYYGNNHRETVFAGTLQLVFGKQWVFDNAFAIDMFAGIGYGFTTQDNYGGYQYGFTVADNSFPIAFSSGLKIGYLFK